MAVTAGVPDRLSSAVAGDRGLGGRSRPQGDQPWAHARSALLIACAFLMNRNVYDSDNYRYLIFLLTPWALGFGLILFDLRRRGRLAALLGVARGGSVVCE